jgi:hypothetical protein
MKAKAKEIAAQERRWMRHWRRAAIALEQVKRDELASLTPSEAWRKTESLLSLAPHYRRLSRTSGLVEQQAWFHRRKRK